MISVKKLLTITVVLTLAACSSSRGDHSVAANASGASTSLQSSMAVGQVTGGGSYLVDPDAVRDSEFKTALKKLLADQGLLAEKSPAYVIEADISTHLSPGTATEDKKLDEVVEYRVIRQADQKNFQSIIKSAYVVPGTKLSDADGFSASALGRKKSEANEKVTADNLAQFMQMLSTWDQGKGQ